MTPLENQIEKVGSPFSSEMGSRFLQSIESGSFGEIKDTLNELVGDFSEQLKKEPLQAIAAGVALGFFVTMTWRKGGSALPSRIGKGIGVMVASNLIERVVSARTQSANETDQEREESAPSGRGASPLH